MKMAILRFLTLALFISFQSHADETHKDVNLQKIPNYNYNIDKAQKPEVEYRCGTAQFKNQKITKLIGSARVEKNGVAVFIPTENKMAWRITRSEHKVLVEMKDSQGRILFSSQTLEMAPLSAYVASLNEFLICNPFPSHYLLVPSDDASYGVKFQN